LRGGNRRILSRGLSKGTQGGGLIGKVFVQRGGNKGGGQGDGDPFGTKKPKNSDAKIVEQLVGIAGEGQED